jgi:hypothetical protein
VTFLRGTARLEGLRKLLASKDLRMLAEVSAWLARLGWLANGTAQEPTEA